MYTFAMTTQIKALIFDLDGLIVDTETPDYQTWQDVYQDFGHELPLDKWVQIVGGTGASDFDPHTYLEELTGQTLDREQIWIKRRKLYHDLLENTGYMPGVQNLLFAAHEAGLKLAVASSSPCTWVHGHLNRLGAIDLFDEIVTADNVEKTKPDPALFLLAAEMLGVETGEAIVFEDSLNGVLAANSAGIFVVAVPNAITKQLDFSGAELVLGSLADTTLEKLLDSVNLR